MTDDIMTQVEAARARVQAQANEARARRETLRATANEIKHLSTTVRSARGDVSVTAHMSGVISSVEISTGSVDERNLGALVTQTIAAAQQAVRDLAADRMTDIAGADAHIVQELRSPMNTTKGE